MSFILCIITSQSKVVNWNILNVNQKLFWINRSVGRSVHNKRVQYLIDPVTAIAGATAAFNTIKAGFAAGREIESMAGDLGRWMNSVSDIRKAEELNKKPPIFKKLFAGGSVEEEALQIFMAKKKAEDMREQLKQIISFSRGPSAWEELLRTEADIRKKRQKMIYDQEERRRKLGEAILVGILICIVGGSIIGFAYLFASTRGML